MTYCNDCGKEFKRGDRAYASTVGYISEDGFSVSLDDEWENVTCIKCEQKEETLTERLRASAKTIEAKVEDVYIPETKVLTEGQVDGKELSSVIFFIADMLEK